MKSSQPATPAPPPPKDWSYDRYFQAMLNKQKNSN